MLAPIGISVYTRLNHFKKAISALKHNLLASQSNLIVYSDAASKEQDIDLVNQVREFARNIEGFRTVTVIERPHNYGGVKNAHQAVLQLVRVFKKAIFIEDDIETAPGFLQFMNSALDYYQDNPAVTSISGYSPPLYIGHYVQNDYFVMNRFCGWGCGVYERTAKWLSEKISNDEFESLADKRVLCEFGDDVLHMVEREVRGELDAADVRCMFRQAIHQTATIYPKFSLVQNIGHDGSGYHCGVTKRFWHKKLWDKTTGFEFSPDLKVDERIKKEKQDFRSFKGRYEILRVIYNQEQSKKVALNYINRQIEKDLKALIQAGQAAQVKSNRVAILCTQGVGSSWLCELLFPYFGESIRRDWLHKRYLDVYQIQRDGSSPLDYLDFVKNYAFTDCENFGLHIHVNQVIIWMEEFGIDIFEFFDFDYVVYMSRDDQFEQVYSLATASESGLWGNEVISAMTFADDFKVSVSHESFERAFFGLQKEKKYFDEHISEIVSEIIQYEQLRDSTQETISSIFEEKYKLVPKIVSKHLQMPLKNRTFVCEENKRSLKPLYDNHIVNQHN